jgi:hypothetical protein
MTEPTPTCQICAWRQNCNKKFSIKDPSKCPDYTRDLKVKITKDEDTNEN